MKTILSILILSTVLILAESKKEARIPIPPLPSAQKPTARSKKAEHARLLREAAEAMDKEAQMELDQLGHDISNKVAAVDFSTPKYSVKVKAISFMDVGTNYLMQVTFEYQEK